MAATTIQGCSFVIIP